MGRWWVDGLRGGSASKQNPKTAATTKSFELLP
jgi:hypothetical protein